MKKISYFVIVFTMLCTVMGSCDYKLRRTKLKTEIDTLSYFYGWARTEGLREYLINQVGIDTAFMNAFYKGFRDGVNNYSPKDIAYAEGLRIAHVINNMWISNLNNEIYLGDSSKSVNRDAVMVGFYNGLRHYDESKILNANSFCQTKISELRERAMLEKYAGSIRENEKFLAENKKKADVKTTESGLQYKILQEGKGDIPDASSWVKIKYKATLIDGTEVENSGENPASQRVGQSIKGWSEALKMMPVGSKWELYIPQELGYGSLGNVGIPPYATLIYEFELIEIQKK
jgi:FKBP-type peptidyl-prolyl cis-trans isomerase FklB